MRDITNYEALSATMGEMRNAAANGEWERLIDLEQQCAHRIAMMRSQGAVAAPDEPMRRRKMQIIRKILADDAEIRNRTESWMGQLRRIMHSNRQEQRLQQAYGG